MELQYLLNPDWNLAFGEAAGIVFGTSVLLMVYVIGHMIVDLIETIIKNLEDIRHKY